MFTHVDATALTFKEENTVLRTNNFFFFTARADNSRSIHVHSNDQGSNRSVGERFQGRRSVGTQHQRHKRFAGQPYRRSQRGPR